MTLLALEQNPDYWRGRAKVRIQAAEESRDDPLPHLAVAAEYEKRAEELARYWRPA